jgi:hypothetical protein
MAAGLHRTIREAFRTTLRADAALQALGSGSPTEVEVWSAMAPDGYPLPYLSVSGASGQPFDTKDSDGLSAVVDVHVWTDYRGELQCLQLMDAVTDALHDAALILDNADLVMCILNNTAGPMLDPDGRTLHGVCSFTVVTDRQ